MADSRPYTRGRTRRRKLSALLVLAVLASFVLVQTAAAISVHPDHDGPNDHCCAACHGGHYPVLKTTEIVHVTRFAVAAWHQLNDDERPVSREWIAVNSCRAPPV
jgi:hypothetical protein